MMGALMAGMGKPFVPGDDPEQNLPDGEPAPDHPDFRPDVDEDNE